MRLLLSGPCDQLVPWDPLHLMDLCLQDLLDPSTLLGLHTQ